MKGIFFENKRILILFFFFSAVFLSISFLYSFSSSSSDDCSGCYCTVDGYYVRQCKKYDSEQKKCLECETIFYRCNSEYTCGCDQRADKYRCYIERSCESDGATCWCSANYITTYCGESTDSDNGDNPNIKGTAIDKYCSNGVCKEDKYEDYCTGICSRDRLIEYYVEDDRVRYKEYSNLFSQNKYCKNGAMHEDKNRPSVSLSLGSRNWGNTDITETLNCGDHDESGCWKYNYKIIRVV
ncbi:MAG: hypothetical protein QXW35_03385 [Candidatus Aenigmatarchaeota archaeon]